MWLTFKQKGSGIAETQACGNYCGSRDPGVNNKAYDVIMRPFVPTALHMLKVIIYVSYWPFPHQMIGATKFNWS